MCGPRVEELLALPWPLQGHFRRETQVKKAICTSGTGGHLTQLAAYTARVVSPEEQPSAIFCKPAYYMPRPLPLEAKRQQVFFVVPRPGCSIWSHKAHYQGFLH